MATLDKPSTDVEPHPDANPAPPPQEHEGLQRRLNSRQLTMIAIGGAIGVGLFLGSSVTIDLAGPGVIVSYLLGALIAIVMAYSLAEMAVSIPLRVHLVSTRRRISVLGPGSPCGRPMDWFRSSLLEPR